MLDTKGVVLSSRIMYAHMRDESGSRIDFKNGDRFLYCQRLPNSIPRQRKMCGFYCSVYHHGRDNTHVCKSGRSQIRRQWMPCCAEEGDIIALMNTSTIYQTIFITLIHAFVELVQTSPWFTHTVHIITNKTLISAFWPNCWPGNTSLPCLKTEWIIHC